jgi:hypothetical protein
MSTDGDRVSFAREAADFVVPDFVAGRFAGGMAFLVDADRTDPIVSHHGRVGSRRRRLSRQ